MVKEEEEEEEGGGREVYEDSEWVDKNGGDWNH